MKKVYSANNLIEAQIVVDLLEQAYIPGQIFNQHAQGAVGDIPFTHAYPEVWVIRDEDYERSRSIIQTYEATPVTTDNTHCLGCGEENPINFQLCWKCNAGLEISLYSGNAFKIHCSE